MSQRRHTYRKSAPRRKRARVAPLVVAGVSALGLVALGCVYSAPEPPDMPPFAGTEEFLAEQQRVREAGAAEEAFRERYNLAGGADVERRGREYLMQIHEAAERSRMIEDGKKRERDRLARAKAEQGARRFHEMEEANKYREDLRMAELKAEQGRLKFAQVAEANKHRDDLQREQDRAAEGKRRFADSEYLQSSQKRDAQRKSMQKAQDARKTFTEGQSGRRS
jgi:hypothetical protein